LDRDGWLLPPCFGFFRDQGEARFIHWN
jgi:hypothetical protein